MYPCDIIPAEESSFGIREAPVARPRFTIPKGSPPPGHVTASRPLATAQRRQKTQLDGVLKAGNLLPTSVTLLVPASPWRVYFPNRVGGFPGTARQLVPMLFREGRCVGILLVPVARCWRGRETLTDQDDV